MKFSPEMLPNLLALIPEASQTEIITNLKNNIKENQKKLGSNLFYILTVSESDNLLLSAYRNDPTGNLELITTSVITNIDSVIKSIDILNNQTQNLINEIQPATTGTEPGNTDGTGTRYPHETGGNTEH